MLSTKSCPFCLKSRPECSVSVPVLTILVRQHQLCFELLISCSYEQCSEYECWGTLIELHETHCAHLMNCIRVKRGYPLFLLRIFWWIRTSVHARNCRWWPLVMSALRVLFCSSKANPSVMLLFILLILAKFSDQSCSLWATLLSDGP